MNLQSIRGFALVWFCMNFATRMSLGATDSKGFLLLDALLIRKAQAAILQVNTDTKNIETLSLKSIYDSPEIGRFTETLPTARMIGINRGGTSRYDAYGILFDSRAMVLFDLRQLLPNRGDSDLFATLKSDGTRVILVSSKDGSSEFYEATLNVENGWSVRSIFTAAVAVLRFDFDPSSRTAYVIDPQGHVLAATAERVTALDSIPTLPAVSSNPLGRLAVASHIQVSPDGRFLGIVRSIDGFTSELSVYELSATRPKQILRTTYAPSEGGSTDFVWSPDSQEVAHVANMSASLLNPLQSGPGRKVVATNVINGSERELCRNIYVGQFLGWNTQLLSH